VPDSSVGETEKMLSGMAKRFTQAENGISKNSEGSNGKYSK